MKAVKYFPPHVKGYLQEDKLFSVRSRIDGKFCEFRANGPFIDNTSTKPGAKPIRAHRLLFSASRLVQSRFQRLSSLPLPCLDLSIPFDYKCNFAILINFFYERIFEFAKGSYDHLLAFHALVAFSVVHNILNFTTDLLHAIPKLSESLKNLAQIMNKLLVLKRITICRTAEWQNLIDEGPKRVDASYDAIIDAPWLWLSLATDPPDLLQFLTPALLARVLARALARVLARTERINEQLLDLIEQYLAPQRETISAVDLQSLSSVIDCDDNSVYQLFFQSDLWWIDSAIACRNLSQILECRRGMIDTAVHEVSTQVLTNPRWKCFHWFAMINDAGGERTKAQSSFSGS
jgi:succinate dehydrogenase flavin-adding protein (antitoxin of CptAB toxin-antitoxin module)